LIIVFLQLKQEAIQKSKRYNFNKKMRTTKIEWTDKTWNPITGCTKLSAGCTNCYAEVMSRRLQAMRQEPRLQRGEIGQAFITQISA